MKKKVFFISGIIVVIILIGILVTRRKSGDLNIKTETVSEHTVETSVTATGYVQPVDDVSVGTQVSGEIKKIYVTYNSKVKKGELLAELDKSTLNEKLLQAKASVSSAKSALLYAEQNYNRIKKLYLAKAETRADFEEAKNQYNQAKMSLVNAEADLHQANVNLSYAEIYSPIDGVILNKAVEQGQTVAASFSTPTLFTIAKDLTKMQVEANVDEADIGQVQLDQKVTFTVDAFPDDVFSGKVKQIRLSPTVTNNVVTYTVIIEAPNKEEKLKPGMTASVTIVTQETAGLAVPVSALNFSMTKDIMKLLGIKKINNNDSRKGVWVRSGENYSFKPLSLGVSDGVYTIVTKGITLGDKVVLSVEKEKKADNTSGATSNPLMPSPPKSKK